MELVVFLGLVKGSTAEDGFYTFACVTLVG